MNKELLQRILTGFFGSIFLIYITIYGGSVGIFLISFFISLGMIFEISKMIFSLSDKLEKRYFLLIISWIVSFLNFFSPGLEFPLLEIAFFCHFAYFLFIAKRHKNSFFLVHFSECAFSFFSLFYLVFIPFYLLKLYRVGSIWVLFFLSTVWMGDTFAYFFGKSFGKKKLYAEISPQKTWEGAFAGLGIGCLSGLIFKVFFIPILSLRGALFISFLVGLAAQVGDLCESFLKRAFHVKNSGSFLPGHGGLLDRFDGVILSLPVMYACMKILF